MQKFYSFTLMMVLMLSSALSLSAAQPFGTHITQPRAPKGFTPPAKSFDTHLRRDLRSARAMRTTPFEMQMPKAAEPKFTESAPARVTANGTNLYGYLNFTRSYNNNQGWYQFNPDGITCLWRDPLFTYDNGYGELQTSWVREGKLCGFDNWYQYGYFWGQTYYEIDLKTGTITSMIDDEDCIWDAGVFMSAVYDPEEDAVYGYATDEYENEDSSKGLFQKTANYPFGFEVIKEIPSKDYNTQCISMCYNPIDKNIYGITLNFDLVIIDRKTGNQTKVAHINAGNPGQYVTGMTYSTSENTIMWNPAYSDYDSAIATIDPKTGAFTKIMQFNTGDSFGCLAEIGSKVNAESPARPEIVSTNFPDGATSGNIVYKLPTQTVAGVALSGDIAWQATLDGRNYKNGTGKPGAEITIQYDDLATAEHTFGMYATSGSNEGASATVTFYTGYDIPAAPALVTLEKDNIHWSTVKTGVNGGYIDTSDLQYEVYLNGQLVQTTPRTSFKIEVGKGQPYQNYQATVYAICHGRRSNATLSNVLATGDPWELPVDIVASQKMLDLMTIINVDGEEYNTWEVDPNRDAEAFYSGQADDGRGDDWLILPAINFPDASKYYSFYITCMRVANVYDDAHLEICFGEYPDPSSMEGNVIIPDFVPQSRDYKEFSNPLFKVPYAGEYYIGLHATTGKDMCGVMVHEIRIEDNALNPDSPAAATDIKATPGTKGALEATVSFKMPTTTINGQALPADAALTAKVTGDNFVEVTGKPGETKSATVQTVQGDNTISIVVSYDGKSGDRALTQVYTGVSIPGLVNNMTVSEHADMMGADFTWTAPDAYVPWGYVDPDAPEGYVDPSTVDYYLVISDPVSGTLSTDYIGTGITSYTLNLPDGAAQDLYTVGIAARNEAGSNGKYMGVELQLGTPYVLDMKDDFENGEQFKQQPWLVYSTGARSNVDWFLYPISGIATEWKDMDGIALCGVGYEDQEDRSILGMPRFSTEEQEVAHIEVKAWTGEQSALVKVLAQKYGQENAEIIGEFPYSDSDKMSMWKTVSINIPDDYIHQPWVQLAFDATFGEGHNYVIIDEILVSGNFNEVYGLMAAEGTIFAEKGCIRINGFANCDAFVYALDGKLIASRKITSDESEIYVAPGMYIVKAGSRTVKLVVR